jgi:Ni/Fe-hydrogenase subunit HybB-like protein
MLYRLAADAVLLGHFAFIAFVILGGLFVLRRRRVAFVHVPAVAWAAAIVASGHLCPLTILENALRTRAGASGYGESFIEHYLLHVIYPPGLTPAVQIALAIGVVAINAVIYMRLMKSRHAAAAGANA